MFPLFSIRKSEKKTKRLPFLFRESQWDVSLSIAFSKVLCHLLLIYIIVNTQHREREKKIKIRRAIKSDDVTKWANKIL